MKAESTNLKTKSAESTTQTKKRSKYPKRVKSNDKVSLRSTKTWITWVSVTSTEVFFIN